MTKDVEKLGAGAGPFSEDTLTQEPSWTQVNARNLAIIVGVALAAVLVVSMSVFWWGLEKPTLEAAERFAESKAQVYERYTALNEAWWNRFHTYFQLLVGTVLLPLFTLLLGYAFGSRKAE